MKNLLIIGAGRLQVPAFDVARRLGLHVIAVDRDPRAPGMALADEAHAVDTRDLGGILALAARRRVDGVVTICTDQPVRVVAEVASRLGLVGISPDAALRATHKGHMRDAFARAGAPIPAFRRVHSDEEARAAAEVIGLPVIVKPPASSGSRGVFKVDRPEQLQQALAHARIHSSEAEVLVEGFIEGPEVSVETISFAGEHHIVAITDKRTSGDPYWVEMGHAEPSRLPNQTQLDIREATLAGLAALGIDSAAGHVEMRIGPQGPRLVEIGARLGGDFITTELVRRSTGVDMVEAVIRMALGEAPELTPRWSRGAAIRYLSAPPGIVSKVSGVENARAMPGVKRIEIDAAPGDRTREPRNSLDRCGFVVCEGRDAAEAEDRAVRAAAAVRFEICPEVVA